MKTSRRHPARAAVRGLRSRAVLCAVLACATLALTVPAASVAADAPGGVAATAHPLATEAALAMFDLGGNAVDAAVAAAFAIGVVEPHGSGLGGGGGMLVHLRDRGRTVYLNFYQSAQGDPAHHAYDRKEDHATARAVIVPGTVAGLCRALDEWGTLPLATVIAPAIRYAEEGFPVDGTLAGLILDSLEFFMSDPDFAGIFLVDGFPLMEGELLRQPALAGVLRRIAAEGRDGFYRGEFAETLVRELTARGGGMSLADLAGYEADLVRPVRGTYRGLEVVTAPPPHAGVTLLNILNMVELIDIDPQVHFTASAPLMHRIAEIFRRAYADRSQFVGDPRFVDVPVAGLTSKAYARERFGEINPYRAEPRNYRDTPAGAPLKFARDPDPAGERVDAGTRSLQWSDERDDDPRLDNRFLDDPFERWRRERRDASGRGRAPVDTAGALSRPFDDDEDGFDGGGYTTHLSVIDGDGNMVSLTQTLGTFFGARVVIDGVIMNNGRNNFSDISPANIIAPGKRPRSSISPTLVFRDGRPFVAIGSPGAGRIIAAIAEVLINIVDYGMGVEAANAAPRFFCQKFEDHFYVESRIDQDVQRALTRMGHSVRVLGGMDLFFGGVAVTAFDPARGGLVGSADPRRSGEAGTLLDRLQEVDSD
ncbi:MAG: gamma-glutamyltransferase family protein [Candidatus Krumholzibacteriia bacterium]